MSSHFLPTVQLVEGDDDACTDVSLIAPGESREGTNSVVSVPHTALTLSNPLVQFLSPLQLQGYASRLIEKCGVHHMHELAARVTSQDDVDQLLGSLASLQQRREFWKGICKWKQTAEKHKGEKTRRSAKTKKKITACADLVDGKLAPQFPQNPLKEHIGDLDNCTPSQFIRQFAFCGYKDAEVGVKRQRKVDRCDDEVSPLTKTSYKEGCDAAVQTPLKSTLCTSPQSSHCDSPFYSDKKRFCREKIPLGVLSMGGEVQTTDTIRISGEWGRSTESPLRSRESVMLAAAVQQKKESSNLSNIVCHLRAEHEALRIALSTTIKSALVAYNEGLGKIQERVRLALMETRDNQYVSEDAGLFELASSLSCEPYLLAELRPAESHQAGTVLTTAHGRERESDICCNAEVRSALPNGCDKKLLSEEVPADSGLNVDKMRFSLLANMTILSSLSCSLGEKGVSTISEITSLGRGSHLYERLSTGERDIMRRSTKPCNHHQAVSQPVLSEICEAQPATFFPEMSNVAPAHFVQEAETLLQTSTASEGGGVVVGRPPPCLVAEDLVDCAFSVSFEEGGVFSLENFGLNALGKEEGVAAASRCSHRAADSDWSKVFLQKERDGFFVEDHIIDVDALSCSHYEVEETDMPLIQKENDCSVNSIENSDDQQLVFSNPLLVGDFCTQSEQDFTCTQMCQRRLPAVSRGSSSSSGFSLQKSCETFEEPRLTRLTDQRTKRLDWTTTSSIAADAQHLSLKILDGDEQTCWIESAGDSATERASDTASATAELDVCPVVPQGLPPLSTRSILKTAQVDWNDTTLLEVDELSPEMVMSMGYNELRQWCRRLGLCVASEQACGGDAEKAHMFSVSGFAAAAARNGDCDSNSDSGGFINGSGGLGSSCELTRIPAENSNGWWVHNGGASGDISEDDVHTAGNISFSRSPHRQGGIEGNHAEVTFFSTACDEDSEWCTLQRESLAEKMREQLRVFIARRTFMQQVVPSFFYRLPRFSLGPPYKPVRAADLLKRRVALTREELEEQRCFAKATEAEEVVCCVITSLAGEAAERIERQALSAMKEKRGTNDDHIASCLSKNTQSEVLQVTYNTTQLEHCLFEQLLLMEPVNVQAVVELVQSDFPHISRYRVETLLEESGVPLELSRRACNRQNVSNGDLSLTQDSTLLELPPPSFSACLSQRRETADGEQKKSSFFAQRHWMQRRRVH